MKKIMILSVFPAPYRIAVFKGIAKQYDTLVCFEKKQNEERSKEWFENSGKNIDYLLLDDVDGMENYSKEVREIKKYDLIICYDPFTSLARKLQNCCIKNNIKYIINADGALDIKRFGLKALVKRYYIHNACMCFAGSQKAEEYFWAYGANKKKIINHNFTSLYRNEILLEPLSKNEKTVLRKKYRIDNIVTFLAVGQFVYRKGFDLLLNAWEQDEHSQLIIIGGGSKKNEYLDIISQKGIKNVIIYDFMPHEQLKDFYKLSDVFIMPTREDIWGLVVNEALSLGLPVVSSDRCTAGLELIQNQINGYIYPVNDTGKLAEIISYYKNNLELLPIFSCEALKSISEYCYENIIDSHLENINNILRADNKNIR